MRYIPAGAEAGHREATGEVPADGVAPEQPKWVMEGHANQDAPPSDTISISDLPPLPPLTEFNLTAKEIDDAVKDLDEIKPLEEGSWEPMMDDFLFEACFQLEEERYLDGYDSPTESEEERLLADEWL